MDGRALGVARHSAAASDWTALDWTLDCLDWTAAAGHFFMTGYRQLGLVLLALLALSCLYVAAGQRLCFGSASSFA